MSSSFGSKGVLVPSISIAASYGRIAIIQTCSRTSPGLPHRNSRDSPRDSYKPP